MGDERHGASIPDDEIDLHPCFKCGKPSYDQWHICSVGSWEPVCVEHDIQLNEIGLRWAYGDEAAARIIDTYAREARRRDKRLRLQRQRKRTLAMKGKPKGSAPPPPPKPKKGKRGC